MTKNLVIVESPSKARTIKKYLGRGFSVVASVGHIKDLPKSKLGVDFKNGFEPQYEVIKSKKKVVDAIKQAAVGVDCVFLALDPDREGEAIAWHVAQELGYTPTKKKGKKGPEIRRVLFNEITKRGIDKAMAQPCELDPHLYEAQQARRVLDRLVGYEISPILWDKVRRGLSAGRVQSVAVRLICEREEEIKKFVPEEYWSLTATVLGSKPPEFKAKLVEWNGEKFRPGSQTATGAVVKALQGASFVLSTVIRKEKRRFPLPPFITSRLQQEAARRLGFSASKTMVLAQQLYEGVDIGESGPTGLITYMRTDSTRVADEALAEARDLIGSQYGKEYLPEGPNVYPGKKGAQDAHEAIRPTQVALRPEDIKEFLEPDALRLYELIWKRFMASQMVPAVMDQTAFDIAAGKGKFRASGSVMKFPGFMTLYIEAVEDDAKAREDEGDEEDAERTLPDLQEGEALKAKGLDPRQHFTEPPPRYSEASLIRELEEKGIGRPSTYASILSTIQDREYAKKEQLRFHPTKLGEIVNGLLVSNFPNILNVTFTARMEEELDEVEEGKRRMKEALKDFYKPFKETLEVARVAMKNIKRTETKTDLTCEKCGAPMVVKWGRRGEFLACTGYPDCKNTKDLKRNSEGDVQAVKSEVTGEFCATCGSPMVRKTGRFGAFMACSRYPECKTTRPMTTKVDCPKCGSKLAQRQTRHGKIFFGCSGYPKCDFALWNKPLPTPCPVCGAKFVVEKYSKKTGNYKACAEKTCDWKEAPETPAAPVKDKATSTS